MKLEPIDTSTTAGKARVMQLAAEGRKVAYRGRSHAYRDDVWNTANTPTWGWDDFDYAIIAQPVGPHEVWVIVAGDHLAAGPFKDEQTAIDCSESFRNVSNHVVRYRRVEE